VGDQQSVVVGAEVPGQRLAQGRDLAAQPAAGQIGQGFGIGLPGQQRVQDRSADLGPSVAYTVVMTRPVVVVGVSRVTVMVLVV
jgi:hypothetical protein